MFLAFAVPSSCNSGELPRRSAAEDPRPELFRLQPKLRRGKQHHAPPPPCRYRACRATLRPFRCVFDVEEGLLARYIASVWGFHARIYRRAVRRQDISLP